MITNDPSFWMIQDLEEENRRQEDRIIALEKEVAWLEKEKNDLIVKCTQYEQVIEDTFDEKWVDDSVQEFHATCEEPLKAAEFQYYPPPEPDFSDYCANEHFAPIPEECWGYLDGGCSCSSPLEVPADKVTLALEEIRDTLRRIEQQISR